MNTIIAKIKAVYRSIVDHLTKALGIFGAGLMSYLSFIDPEAIGNAAQKYLGAHAYAKIGVVLFALVTWRGWWAGKKAKEQAAALADAQAALRAAAPRNTA